MTAVHAVDGAELWWVYADGAHELQAGDRVVARLDIGAITTAQAEAAEGQWEFEHRGMFFPKVVIRPTAAVAAAGDAAGSAGDAQGVPPTAWVVATWRVTPTWRGAWILRTPHGRTLRWRQARVTSPDWVCEDEEGHPLIACRLTEGAALAEVQLAPSAQRVPELALVLLLGWYLVEVWEYLVQTGG
jgi:hypothetical protein